MTNITPRSLTTPAFLSPAFRQRFAAAAAFVAVLFTPLLPVLALDAGAGGAGALFAPSATGYLKLDNTFDGDGSRTDGFGLSSDSAVAAVLLPDGKIVAAVNVRTGDSVATKTEGVIVRFNADGTRDLTFASTCRASATFGLTTTGISDIAVQTDGKVVFVGTRTNFINPGGTGTSTSSFVQRCNPDGSNDPTFTPGGLNLGTQGSLSSVRVRPDGKIVIAGRSQASIPSIPQLGIFRLNPNGSLDPTFAGDGQAFTAQMYSAGPMALQSDGKVYIAGSGNAVNLVRVDDNGAADPTFHGDGYLQTPFTAAALVVQPDGKLLVAGTSANDFAVARYNADGSLDATFDTDGVVATPVGPGNDAVQSIAVQDDGKIVVAGKANNGSNDDIAIVRYNADGSLDTSFDGDGKMTMGLHSGADSASRVLVRPDGKLVAVGTTHTGASNDVALVQYFADGTLDTTFGTDGRSVLDLENQYSGTSAVAVQADGKVVVAGSAVNGDLNYDFAIARYNADGTPDTSFDGDGKATSRVLSWNDYATSVAVQSDGKIVVAGRAQVSDGGGWDFAAVRFNTDGSLDSSFDGDGRVSTAVSGSDDMAYSVAIQADGKVVIAGVADVTSNLDFAVVRYNADGSLDTTFDGDGKAVTAVSAGGDVAFAVKVQSDAKIVAVGIANGEFGLARYNTDGSLDATFDGDGKVTTSFGTGSAAYSAALQAGDKIVAAGTTNGQFAFARYNADGSLDTGFDGDGKMTTSVTGNTNQVRSLAIQADGKIVAGGSASLGGNSVLALARLNPNGTLDTSFDADGRAYLNVAGSLQSIALDSQNRMIGAVRMEVPFGSLTSFMTVRVFARASVQFDHEGNGAADLAVWRPANNNWYTQTSAGYSYRAFGQAGDKLAPADYDGDGSSDIAIFRPADGSWHILNSSTQTLTTFTFGQDGDLPLSADRNADGAAEPVLYRPSTSTWYTRFSSTSTVTQSFGVSGDRPLLGDFDGDGRADNAVYRPSSHIWYIQGTSSGFRAISWGVDDDVLVPADYDGDGATDMAVWRPSTGRWYIIGSSMGWHTWQVWGVPTDQPVPADYDGDGKADIAVWRPSTGTWYIINSGNQSIYTRQFGQDGDVPVPAAFVY